MQRKILFAAVLATLALTAGCKRKASGPEWQPDPAFVGQLSPAQNMDAYQIQTPQGYNPVPSPPNAPAGSQLLGWAGPNRADGTAASVSVLIATPSPADASKTTSEQFLQKTLEGIQKRRQSWTQTAFENGQINGIPFLRSRWSGVNTANGMKMQGFMYVTKDGSKFVALSSQDFEPFHTDTLKIAEAAVLTLRKR